MKRLIYATLALSLFSVAGCDKKTEVDPAEAATKFETQLKDAAARVRNNKLDDAAEIYERLEKDHGEDPRVLGGIGTLRFQQADLPAAETYFKMAIAKKGDEPDYHYKLGEVLAHAKRHGESAASYGQAFELNPDNSDYGIAAGVALNKAEMFEEAEKVLREVAELDPQSLTPENVGVYTLLGDSLRGQKQLDEALKTYMKAQTTYSSDKMARAGAGFVYEDQDDIAHALAEWSAYVQRDCCSDYSRSIAQKKVTELTAARDAAPDAG